LDYNVSAVDRCLRRSKKASNQTQVPFFWGGSGCFRQGTLVVSGRVGVLR